MYLYIALAISPPYFRGFKTFLEKLKKNFKILLAIKLSLTHFLLSAASAIYQYMPVLVTGFCNLIEV